jgi:lysyl-tRNA synthetase class 2
MTLTGVPLLIAVVVAMIATVALTVRLWSRPGRWRLAGRTAGVLVSEALLVLGVGLVANRAEQFYPSWEALGGRTGPAAPAAPGGAGRLDATLSGQRAATVPWHPGGVAAWRLAATPELVVPSGYGARPGVTFPVVLDLGGAHPAAGSVTVHLAPTVRTSPAALRTLPVELRHDLRVTTRGWAIVAPAKDAAFAAALIRSEPGRFAALVLVGAGPAPLTGIAEAVVRARPGATPVAAGVTVLRGGWRAAVDWAAGRTAAPLAAPLVLPSAPHSRRVGRA